jgi:hypothetical protein
MQMKKILSSKYNVSFQKRQTHAKIAINTYCVKLLETNAEESNLKLIWALLIETFY